MALLSLEPNYISWPTPEEHHEHASCAMVVSKGFAGCVGFIDGTAIPLERRPSYCGDFFLIAMESTLGMLRSFVISTN